MGLCCAEMASFHFFFFLRNKSGSSEKTTPYNLLVMTYTTWDGGLWGTDSNIYCCFFLLILSENVQCCIAQVSH